jgi:thiamine kinase-like enzyme
MREATDADREAVRRVLAGIVGEPTAELSIAPLGGGITNKNFRVDVAIGGATTQTLVVRFGGRGTAELGIDRRREQTAMRVAEGLGVGAEVVSIDPDRDIVVTRFIAGSTLDEDEAARPETLTRVAATLRRIHQGPAFEGTFSPFATVREYADRARQRGVELPPDATPALAVMARVEAALGPAERLTPCHNDLLPANAIDDGSTIRVIDWEYAAMGDPLFDLGNYAANAALSDERARHFLESYAGTWSPRAHARLALMRVASDLREAFWGVLQMALSAIDFDFEAYARRHLARVLQAARSPELERSLRAAS